jgi:hypothetical protein
VINQIYLLFTMSTPTLVDPSGPARNLRSHTPSTTAPPPALPQAGATTHAPDHRKTQPAASTTEKQLFNPIFGHNAIPLDLATIAHLTTTPLPNRFAGFADLDEDSPPADNNDDGLGPLTEIPPNDTTVRKDGGSLPLIDEDDDAFPVATPPVGVTTIVTALTNHD